MITATNDPYMLAEKISHLPDLKVDPTKLAISAIQLDQVEAFTEAYFSSRGDGEVYKKIRDDAKSEIDNKRSKYSTEDDFKAAYGRSMMSSQALKHHRTQIGDLLATHGTSDFPLWFRSCREYFITDSEKSCPAQFRRYARIRTVNNCKKIVPLEFSVDHGLTLVCENEGVEYTTIRENEGAAYGIGKYERAVKTSFEMQNCGSIDGQRQIAREFGEKAAEVEVDIATQALADGLARTPLLTNPVGNPGPVSFDKLREAMQTFNCDDGQCCDIDTILFGAGEKLNVADLLGREFINAAEGVPNTFRFLDPINEPTLDRALGGDWLLFDSRKSWLEYSVMQEFRGGPLLLFQDADVQGTDRWGRFDDMSYAFKALFIAGAGVVKDDCVIRVEGCSPCS